MPYKQDDAYVTCGRAGAVQRRGRIMRDGRSSVAKTAHEDFVTDIEHDTMSMFLAMKTNVFSVRAYSHILTISQGSEQSD